MDTNSLPQQRPISSVTSDRVDVLIPNYTVHFFHAGLRLNYNLSFDLGVEEDIGLSKFRIKLVKL